MAQFCLQQSPED